MYILYIQRGLIYLFCHCYYSRTLPVQICLVKGNNTLLKYVTIYFTWYSHDTPILNPHSMFLYFSTSVLCGLLISLRNSTSHALFFPQWRENIPLLQKIEFHVLQLAVLCLWLASRWQSPSASGKTGSLFVNWRWTCHCETGCYSIGSQYLLFGQEVYFFIYSLIFC